MLLPTQPEGDAMTRILIVNGNPKPASFCAALADAYETGARSAGHEVERIDLGALPIDPVLRTGFTPHDPEEPELTAAREAIGRAQHLVLVWPLWFGDMPAILKGFLERALTMGFAAEEIEKPPFFRPLLTGRSARSIVTMQMPRLVYRLVYGSAATKLLRRHILGFVGMSPVRDTVFGGIDDAAPETRAKWLEEVRRLGAAAV